MTASRVGGRAAMQRAVDPSSSDIGGSIPSRPTRNPRKQGAVGVARAIAYYSAKGYAVFVPVSDVSRFDLVVDTGDRLLRVEVKTSRQASGEVDLRTSGGNRSWSGIIKKISAADCDVVFAINLSTGVEREFPVGALVAMRSITLR